MADTRKDRRAPVSLKVRFKSATVDEFIEHYCKDVSRGGIFIKSSQPMAIGTLLKFQFQLKDESSLIKGVGRVVWTRSPEDAVADQPAGMGIKFIKMDNESKAIVERIVDSHGDDGGAFDQGRATASAQETPSERPHAQTDNFFPDAGPAELPPPEDRTAVRQAAQFLAAALAEGGTDQAAKREAEEKAEEARQRTAQIEAQRLTDAQARDGIKTIPAPGSASPLPSMIIDPSLGSEEKKASLPSIHGSGAGAGEPEAQEASLESGSISTPPPARAPTTSFPPVGSSLTPTAPSSGPARSSEPPRSSLPPPPERKSPLLWAAVLVGLLVIGAWVALTQKPQEVDAPVPAQSAAKAPEPEPEPLPDPLPEPLPDALEESDSAVAEATPVPTPAPPPDAKLLPVDVRGAAPAEIEVLVNGESRGKTPLRLELAEGVVARLTARAPGYAESTLEVTPAAGQKPLRFALTPLPYVVHVETDPPGAQLSIGARRGTSPADIVIGPAFRGLLGVTARLKGYETANQPLRVEDFKQTADNMLAQVNLTLTPLPAPAVAPAPAKPKPRPVAPPSASEAAPKREPAQAAPAEKPAEAPEPAPAPAAEKPEPAAEKPASEKPAPEKPAPEKPAPEKPAPSPDKLPANPFNE